MLHFICFQRPDPSTYDNIITAVAWRPFVSGEYMVTAVARRSPLRFFDQRRRFHLMLKQMRTDSLSKTILIFKKKNAVYSSRIVYCHLPVTSIVPF